MCNPSPLLWLESRMLFGMKAGLENMGAICKALGNPHRQLRTIHVVGTNGKGSTSFWLMRILEAHGLHVGLFTSPHLVSMRERIRVGDSPISHDDLCRCLEQVRTASANLEVTFFEALTAVAFLWFSEQNTDVVILEGGLGGRLDSTNLCNSTIAVLTSIGLDHTEILGDSLDKILYEKLGVWKPGATLIHNLQDASLCAQIRDSQEVMNISDPGLQQVIRDPRSREDGTLGSAHETSVSGVTTNGNDTRLLQQFHSANAFSVVTDTTLCLPQAGLVYQENASLSMAAAKLFLGVRFEENIARETLQNAVWAGRQQQLHNAQTGAVDWIIDGAHNGHAALRLAETLRTSYPGQKFPLVLAILKTKTPEEILTPLLPLLSEIILTRTPHPKMREPSELAELFAQFVGNLPVHIVTDVPEALRIAGQIPGVKLCTGSLYFVGAVVEELKNDYAELTWFRQFSPDDNERK